MDILRGYIERVSRETIPHATSVIQLDERYLEEFVNDPSPAALFIVQTETQTVVKTSLDSPGTILALVKQGPINLDEQLSGQIFPIAVPNGEVSDSLHAVIHYVVAPYFEAVATAGVATTASNISAARQKIAELELSFHNLQFHTEIQLLDLTTPPLPEAGQEPDLNALQNTVNEWKKGIRSVVRVARDPSVGTASEEVLFWNSMENALTHIESQLQESKVKDTIALLEQGKRFHATVSFPGDTGLPEALSQVQKYNIVLKDIPISDLLVSSELGSVSTALDGIFIHIAKKLRPSSYPVWRALALIEAISTDFAKAIYEQLSKKDLLMLPFPEFQSVMGQVRTLFIQWDDHVREFTNIARDVIRKRAEKFIPVRIKGNHLLIQSRIEYLYDFRGRHEQLLQSLGTVNHHLTGMDLIPKLQTEFHRMATIDVLDTSPEGVSQWNVLEATYNNLAGSVEEQVAKLLRSQLSSARSAQEMFRIFGEFNALFTRPAIRGAIHEYQTRLLQVVKSDITELQSRVNKQYRQSFAFKSASLNDIPSVSGLVIWLRQIRSRLNKLLDRVSSVLGSDWKDYAEGEKLYNEYRSFYDKIDPQPIVSDWVKTVSANQFNLYDPLFTIKRGQLTVNFDPHSGTFFKETRALYALGVHIPHTFTTATQNSRQLYPHAVRLIEDVKVFYACMSQIEANSQVRALVQRDINTVYALLKEGASSQWKNLITIDNQPVFVHSLDQAVLSLEERVEKTVNTTQEINKLLVELKDCAYSKAEFATIISEIKKCVLELSADSECSFNKTIVAQVSKLLADRCIHELDKWQEDNQIHKHNLTLVNQVIVVSPPLCKTRELVYGDVSEIVSQIDCGIEVQRSVWGHVAHTLKSINQMFDEVDNYLRTWFGFQSLWDLKSDQVWEQFGTDINVWQEVLEDLHESRKTLDNESQERIFGCVNVSFAQIHAYVNSKYDNWQNDMVLKFSNLVAESNVKFIGNIRSIRRSHEEVSFLTGSTEMLVHHLETVLSTAESLEMLDSQRNSLQRAQGALTRHRFQFPHSWILSDQINSEWNSLQEIHRLRVGELEQLQQRLVAETQSNISRLENKVSSLYTQWQSSKPVSGSIKPEDALFAVQRFDEDVQKSLKQRDLLKRCCELFRVNFSFEPPLDDMSLEIKDFVSAWNAISETWASLRSLENQPWSATSPRKIRASLNGLLDQTQQMPSRIRQYIAFQHVQNVIRERIKTSSTLSSLHSEAIQQRHWDKLTSMLDLPSKSLVSLTLGDVWSLGLLDNKGVIDEQVKHAEGERRIEVSIQEISAFWSTFTFELVSYRNKVRLIKNWDELFSKIDDHLQALEAMQHSVYFKYFSQPALDWELKISNLRAICDNWVDVQRQWVYLEGVFSTPDIRVVLPAETAKFGTINSELFAIFKMVAKNPNVLETSSIPGIDESMKRLLDLLLKLQRALGDYFERERRQFSRYYFIGDDDLLEMVGMFTPERVEKHLNKMFAGVSRFELNDAHITGVMSIEGEYLGFIDPVSTDSNVIGVLQRVESSVTTALQSSISDAFKSLKQQFQDGDILNWINRPLQAALMAFRLHWSSECATETCRKAYSDRLQSILHVLASQSLVEGETLSCLRLEAIITELVHLKAIIDRENLNWDLQLRYYMNEDLSITVKQASATLKYGFEYQGVQQQLVQTPLIDRMFLTMTQALNQRFGGSPFGPAGTGKTESVKALGQALGMFVVVFCCDETFDFKAITRLLSGICQTGAWACFDEFNRLESNTLSSVSTHVSTIEQALRDSKTAVVFGERESPLDPQTALFVTMNPEYIGRHKLPDNMKNLFRSFAMKHPDKANIIEVLLYSQGFQHAKNLALTLVPFFEDLATNASPQKHYDWGLRAIKSVLRICGALKRKISSETEGKELAIVKKACAETVIPKLVKADRIVYEKLECRFQDAEDIALFNEDLQLEAGLGQYVATPSWVEKVMQLYRFLRIHHGVMLVGESGIGKTSTWSTLAKSSTQEVEVHQMNPKTFSKEVLYGKLDFTTHEWTDGLFTATLRKINENLRGEDKKLHWIIFDGEIDPDWAENLNSVLDDNKILTLPNGERIPLPGNVRIIFEVGSLAAATPATVSRCGMIWFDNDLVGLHDLISHGKSVFRQSFDEDKDVSAARTVLSVVESLDFVKLNDFTASLDHIMTFSLPRVLSTMWSLLESVVIRFAGSNEFLERSVFASVAWAFVGDCSNAAREKFSSWFAPVSGREEIFNYDVSPMSGQWIDWQDTLVDVELEAHDILNPSLVVPTVDTVRHEALLYQLLSVHQPVILCGPPGSGKTMTLLSSLRKSEAFDLVTLNFSKTTSPDLVIRALEQKCSYKSTSNGTVMEPAHLGQWVVLFCDEINLPAQDKFGTQRVVALLREMVGKGGFFKGTQWVQLRRIQFVGACNPPTDVGRIPLDNRFLRLCSLVYVDYPIEQSLLHIYRTMSAALLKCVPELRSYAEPLASAMISVYQQSQDRFQDAMAHYIYSPRELTRWCKGIHAALKDQFALDLDGLVRIWAHEGLRLFSDKLATKSERKWTWDLILETASVFHASPSALETPILFSDWLTKEYSSVNKDELSDFLRARIKSFNDEVIDKKLTLFDEMVEHVLRIDRVLRQPQGHMILMGLSSSGKTTLTKFVCWMNGISVYQIQGSANYTEADFVNDLRAVLKRAGCEGLKTCFILDESNLWDSSFLEKMNTLLANSEVPGLFEQEEFAALLAECRKGASKHGLNLVDEEDLIAWFTRQVSINLHVVFTINSPDNEIISHTATSPALFNRCVLSWMGDWSPKAMAQVCVDQISVIDTGSIPREVIGELSVLFHNTIKKLNSSNRIVTPGEFLSFISQFVRIYRQKRKAVEEEQRHCNVGIEKLKGTMLEVKHLRTELAEKQIDLEKKDVESRAMLQQMLTDQSEAERKKEAGINIRVAIEAQNKEINSRKAIVYKDLEMAEPAVLEAKRGVSNIKKQHLNELRAFTNPPEAVKVTLEAVCYVFGLKHSTWREVMQAVRGEDFIPSIVNFDNEEQMTPDVLHVLETNYMNRASFTYEAVSRASKACAPLQQWITAQVTYATVLKRLEPLNQEVSELERAAEEKLAQENAINEMLEELEASIESYKVRYAQLIADTQTIKAEMNNVERKVDASLHLVSSLESEKSRWSESVSAFQEKTQKLLGDSLLCSAYITYAGYFDQKYREDITLRWQELLDKFTVPRSANLDITGFMSTGQQRQLWRSCGLEMDNLGVENAIMLNEYQKFPFIIDPTNKVQDFLQKSRKLTVTSFLDSSFKKHVESALRFGTSVLIRNAEKLDPVIMPLLNQEFSRRGGRTVVLFDGLEIDIGKDYRLYMVTNDPNICIMPHISSRTTVINFTVTRNSLERIALDEILLKNKPDLESQRKDLINLQGEYQVQLHGLEVQLLSALNASQGNILDNGEVVLALETIKAKAEDIKTKSAAASRAMVEVDKATAEYMPIATTCGNLFNLVNNLSKVLQSYQFSLDRFLGIFRNTVSSYDFVDVSTFLRKLYHGVYEAISPALLQQDQKALSIALLDLFGKLQIDSFNIESMDAEAEFATEFGSIDTRALDDWLQLISESRATIFMVNDQDPTIRLASAASRANRKYKVVALGSAEGELSAETAMNAAIRNGHWVIVQNLHMAPGWMNSLLAKLVKLADADAHPDCRIILTMQLDNPAVPASVLRACRLVSVERPRGLRSGFTDNLAMVESKMRSPPAERTRIYLALAWIHAVIQERQRLGAVGWKSFYDFNDFDFTFAATLLDYLLSVYQNRSNVDPETLDWKYMSDLVVYTTYGAKIDNQEDYHTVHQLVSYIFQADLFDIGFPLSASCPDTIGPETLDETSLAQWLARLPEQEPPEWLGLQSSAKETHLELTSELIRANAHLLV